MVLYMKSSILLTLVLIHATRGMTVFFWLQVSPQEAMIYFMLSVAERSDLVSKKNLGIPGNCNLLSKFLLCFSAVKPCILFPSWGVCVYMCMSLQES